MAVVDEINRIKNNIANAYTACENKGAVIPENANSDYLQSTIESISVESGSSKYGTTVDTFLGDVDNNGVLQLATEESDVVFTGATDLGNSALNYTFIYKKIKTLIFPDVIQISGVSCCNHMCDSCLNLLTVSFPNLKIISGYSAFLNSFSSCTKLRSINFSKLESITADKTCYEMFRTCMALTTIEFPELTTISGQQSCYYMFISCTALKTVNLPKLSNVSGNNCLNNLCQGCTNLEHIYFNALNTSSFGSYTNQFNNLLSRTGNTVTHTLHFPLNMESTISTLTGYPNFGGTSGAVVLAYDLPATS